VVAEFMDGRVLSGETSIAKAGGTIARLGLLPERPRCSTRVTDALRRADVIVAGPGSLYTSILPNLLVDGIAATMSGVDAVRIYVGLPRSMSGGEGPAAGKVRAFARELAARVAPVPVRLCDERLSTVTAEGQLRGQGRKGRKRRAVVDQAAAVVILQGALERERHTGALAGELVPPEARTSED